MQGAQQYAYVDNVIAKQSLTLATSDLFHLLAIAFILMLPLIWLARPPFLSRSDDAAAMH